MMRYAVAGQNSFKRPGSYRFAFGLALMKCFGAIATELINMFKMGQASSVDDIVKDFIAFGIISEIDDLMVMTLSNIDIENEIEQNTITYKANMHDVHISYHYACLKRDISQLSEGTWTQMKKVWSSIFNCLALLSYKLFKFAYVSLYFYFFPALTVVFVFHFGDLRLEDTEADPCG